MNIETDLKNFIHNHLKTIKPLNKQAALAYWKAAVKGDDELYKKAGEMELKIRQVYSNTEDFAFLKEQKNTGRITDPLLRKQLDVLYNSYLENQVEPELLKEMVELGSEIEKKFSNFRATIDGKKVTDNKIDEILKKETDSKKREKVWQAGKQVALEVAADILKLVKLRNKAAK